MLINKLVNFLKILIFSKYQFSLPKEKKILIYDSDSHFHLKNFFNKKNIELFDVRHLTRKNQKINVKIIFYLLINLKLSKENYIKRYFQIVNPKLIITSIDNNKKFYSLKNLFKKAKYISVQNALRTTKNDIFAELNELKKNKKKYRCDYICTFNKDFGKLYKSFCSTKILCTGSILSNNNKLTKKNKIKYQILYISTYRKGSDEDIFLKDPLTTNKQYRRKEIKLIKIISTFAKTNKLALHVLGAKSSYAKEEKEFFTSIIGYKNYNYIPRTINRNSYKIVDQADLIFSTDSTLGYEAASRGNKVFFFFVRPNKRRLNSSKFGWPVKKKNKGNFWTDKVNYDEIIRIKCFFDNKNSSDIKKEMKDVMTYKKNNLELKKLIKSILNEKTK